MNRPENVDFILKDIKSNILDNYVCFLEQRIDKAIEYIKQKQIQSEYTDRCSFRIKENKWWLEDSDILLEILGDNIKDEN